jgi:hypothetical protein
MGLNQFSDITDDEFVSTYLGRLPTEGVSEQIIETDDVTPNGAVDWSSSVIVKN